MTNIVMQKKYTSAIPPTVTKQANYIPMVVESNLSIHGRYALKLNEMRFYIYMVSLIRKGDTDFKTHWISIDEFAELIGISKKNAHRRVKEITDSLLSNYFLLEKGDGSWEKYAIISSAKYDAKNGLMGVSFHPDLAEHLLGQDKNFTFYDRRNVIKLTSTHSQRFYRFLRSDHFRNNHTVVYAIEDIREQLCLGKQYRSYYMFKERVLLRAYEELKEKTDVRFEYEELSQGKGKSITHLKITIHRQKSADTPSLKDQIDTDSEETFGNLVETLVYFGLSLSSATKYLETYGNDHVVEKLDILQEFIASGNEVLNTTGFLISAIEKDYKHSPDSKKVLDDKRKEVKERKANAQSEEKKREEEQNVLFEEYQSRLLEMVQGLDDSMLEEQRKDFISTDNAFIQKALRENGKDIETILESRSLKGNFLAMVAKNKFDSQFHTLEAWIEHKTLSNESPPLSD